MRRLKYMFLLACATFIFGSCDKDMPDDNTNRGMIAVSPRGVIVLNAGGEDIYLRGFFDDAGEMGAEYFGETLISIASGWDQAPADITALGEKPYYPLGGKKIRLFAYTGEAQNRSGVENMVLHSGKAATNDAVLSNYGTTGVSETAFEGKGTPGTSQSPAQVLMFRHVMTQLNVSVENYAGDPPTTMPKSVNFKIDGAVKKGYYPITAIDPMNVGTGTVTTATPSTASNNDYTVVLGTNYLVPTGVNLAGKGKLTYLKIDDYIASDDDLAGFVIEPDPNGTNPDDMLLYPGYAYGLTFRIGRLGFVGIELTQTDWQTVDTDAELSYEPQVLHMFLGDYDATSATAVDDKNNVTMVEIYTNETTPDGQEPRRYTGEGVIENGEIKINFVKLPVQQADVDSISIYTAKGLLLYYKYDPGNLNEYDPATRTINLNLSGSGMRLEDESPGAVNGPDNPYLLATAVQFTNLQKDLDAAGTGDIYIKQTADIDLDVLNLASSERLFAGFNEFNGEYDGGKHYIAGLDLEAPGLFEINHGVIKNMHIITDVINTVGIGYNNQEVQDGNDAKNDILQGELLLETGTLSLIASHNVPVNEGFVYRYGYNLSTGKVFVPTSTALVHDVESLAAVGRGNYCQVCDIDMTGVDWQPKAFYGKRYDGGGNDIINMTINSADTEAGLFSVIQGGSVCNVSLVDPVINVNSGDEVCYVGSITGKLNQAPSEEDINDIINNLPPLPDELSQVVKDALMQEMLAAALNTTANIAGCKVVNPVITVSGKSPVVGAVAGKAGENGDAGMFYSQIWDCYSSGGSIAVNENTPPDNEGAYVGGFIGLNNGLLTRSYTTMTEITANVERPEENPSDPQNPQTVLVDISTGFGFMGDEFDGVTGKEGSITSCFAEEEDGNGGVTLFSQGSPGWGTYTDIWPIYGFIGWASGPGAETFWYDTGIKYPILQLDRK